ncbi:unnamed protein product [Hyaloperonospora brassicae]|uniref:Uncharacterized protein n=1 Tax=Hyaloperonospora brassicae TaxID=162125 RepID=A0AAV0T7D0_HYABA|nr:unnamed protein product [Hyaloperonospora brassicae]
MQPLALFATGALVVAFLPSSVHGHGYMSHPASQWVEGYPNNGYGSTIDNEIWGVYDNAKYGYGPNGTLKFFTETFPTKGYKSLGAFIMENQELYLPKVDPQCGLTVFKESARSELPATELTYTGFTHPGPCEVWCDDTKVLYDSDCQTTYPGQPTTMPYDKAKCAKANRMTIYWIGVHGDPWQVYTHCMWLKGGKGIGSPPAAVTGGKGKAKAASASNATTADASAPTPASPSSTAGSADTADSEEQTASTAASDKEDEDAVDDAPTATPSAATEQEDTPAVEPPAVETPVDEAASDEDASPTVETPDVETPDVETPDVETPAVETPVVETPTVETPVVEAPSTSEVSTGARCVRRRS